MKRLRLLVILLLLLIPLQLSLLHYQSTSGSVAGITTNQSKDVIISVFIGDHRFRLYGYTSPKSLVTFDGLGIFDQVTSDEKGYFEFDNRFSPLSPREACLSSKDQFGRLSSPVCLPPFPINYDVNIGPVIMPPTISLNKQDYFIGDGIMLSGQAVPNTEVKLSMFGEQQGPSLLRSDLIIKSVEAFTFPQLNIKSDAKGNFSINLPSENPKKFRLFAQTNFKKSISANSIKLNLEVLPVWMIIIKFFLFIFSLIKPRLLEITIILEIVYILWVLRGHFHEKAITLYQSHLPEIKHSHLPAVEEEKSLTIN